MKGLTETKIPGLLDLKDKVAIITGGYAWLGYDMACALAEAGCHIIITSRTPGKLNETIRKISSLYGVDTLALTMDQCRFSEVKEMALNALEWKGHIMADQGYGKIINIGSVAGLVGRDRSMYRKNNKMEQPIDYAASKAGVIGMTTDLAAFMAPYGVYVNCISPGGFDKGDLPEGFVKSYSNATALGRMGRMGLDIKGAALFLASQASDYVTGHNLIVDGGFSIWK
jgi:NAD(P)-dependent dehydrogenase (short-subunit alcohol dehydrogenase family)